MKPLKTSETRIIKRSQISLNPYNPKRHTEERVKQQKKNLQTIGYLGGITWNELSGNIIDGHRRIQAMDLYYKYDGTPDTDYDIKVEVVQLNDKQEKEQMTYMALGNTRADLELVARYFPEIDANAAGIDDAYLKELSTFVTIADPIAEIETLDIDDILPAPKEKVIIEENEENTEEPTPEEKKAKVKAAKEAVREQSEERVRNESAYITLSFSDYATKAEFCEIVGIDPECAFCKGEEIMAHIE